jgi:hypothetical protein
VRGLDERVAGALGVPADAEDREVADAFARAARRRLARRPETVKAYVAAAHAASEIVRAERDSTWASPEVASDVSFYIGKRLTWDEHVAAGEDLDLGTDVAWMLGEAVYRLLDDSGLLGLSDADDASASPAALGDLDERLAAALRVRPDAADPDVADAFARAVGLRSATRPETVRACVAAARAASAIARGDRRTRSRADVADEVGRHVASRLTWNERLAAADELDAGEDVAWTLGRAVYALLRDVGVLR